MKSTSFYWNLPASVLAAVATLSSASAATVYTETFPDTGVIASLDSVGWNAKFAGAGNFHPTTSTDDKNDAVIGRNPVLVNSYLFHPTAAGTGANLWWATDFASTAFSTLTTVTFDIANNSATEDIKVAIQSGGSWFVSTTNYNFAGNPNSFQGKSLDFTTATWNALDFDALSVGSSADPSTGPVTAVGFFSSNVVGNVRLDNVLVSNNVPEPSAALLGALGTLGLLRRKR